MIVEDFFFHMSHRILHIKALYPYIHKLHHQYVAPVGICAEYTHPIEFALGNMIPVGIPTFILGSSMHYFTFIIWITFRLVNTVYGHCGYEFSWIPLGLLPF